MACLSLKFVDVKAEYEGVMRDNIAKKCSKSLVIPTGNTTDHMAFKMFFRYCPFIKYGLC